MNRQISAIVATKDSIGPGFSVKRVPVEGRAEAIQLVDDFRVRSDPFPPHPHAGFSAVTYVFPDSPGDLRTRDSLGHDLVTGPGGIVWTQAGRGLTHHETPADPERELHGLQIFVGLSPSARDAAPQVLRLLPNEVPQWRSDGGDQVRVVVGSFAGLASPLVPADPFLLLDITLQAEIAVDLPAGHSAVAYVRDGSVEMRSAGGEQRVDGGHAMLTGADGDSIHLRAIRPAQLVVLAAV